MKEKEEFEASESAKAEAEAENSREGIERRPLDGMEKEATEKAVKRLQVNKEKVGFELKGLNLEQSLLDKKFEVRKQEVELLIDEKKQLLGVIQENLDRLREHLEVGVIIKSLPDDEEDEPSD